ncbi:MAG TPA: gas vesicle protein [Acidobacteriota bacterium]|jgi:hypothetical protein
MAEERIDIFDEESELTLLETVDHVLTSGLVIAGEITISVADIDLVFVGLNVLLGSVDTIDQILAKRQGLGIENSN